MHLKTLNKAIAAANLPVIASYGENGQILFADRNNGRPAEPAPEPSRWLKSNTREEWVEKARAFAIQHNDTPQGKTYSSRSAAKRGMERMGLDIDSLKVEKLDGGRVLVELP